jgi:hypothetical protein
MGVAEYLDQDPEQSGCLDDCADHDLRRAVVPELYSGAPLLKLFFINSVEPFLKPINKYGFFNAPLTDFRWIQ